MPTGDMLGSWGLPWLASVSKANVSSPITYIRGSNQVVIQATYAEEMLRISDGAANSLIERPDFAAYFNAADLILGGTLVEPADGDIVQVTFGTVTKKFRIMPNGREGGWHYQDGYQTRICIRGRYIGSL
jgi:hypothetical protein